MAELALLNVGTGDTKISCSEDDTPEEKAHTAAIIRDMIRKGYAILVEVGKDDKGPLYHRAYDFDPETMEYIVAGLPPENEIASPAPQEEKPVATKKFSKTSSGERRQQNADRAARKRGGRKQTSRVSAARAGAVAVPRTAGG